MSGEAARGGRAQTGGAARHDGGDAGGKFHGGPLSGLKGHKGLAVRKVD